MTEAEEDRSSESTLEQIAERLSFDDKVHKDTGFDDNNLEKTITNKNDSNSELQSSDKKETSIQNFHRLKTFEKTSDSDSTTPNVLNKNNVSSSVSKIRDRLMSDSDCKNSTNNGRFTPKSGSLNTDQQKSDLNRPSETSNNFTPDITKEVKKDENY